MKKYCNKVQSDCKDVVRPQETQQEHQEGLFVPLVCSGSYYLTTTYGALEHIKTFDQQRSATRQLSREVQDSIHRWERRRTLNQEHVDQGSVRVR